MRFIPRLGAARSRLRRGVVAVTALVLTSGVAVATAPEAGAAAGCQVTYTVSSQWSGGFGANVDIKNLGDPMSSWTLKFSFAAGQTITQLWNGSVSQSGGNVSVTNASFNGGLGTGASAQVGFNATWDNNSNPAPAAFTLNGVACTGSVTTSPTPSPTPSPSSSPSRTPTPSPTPTSSPSPSPTGSVKRDGWSTIQAENYDASGGSLQVCSGVLCYVGANAWAQYNGVDLHSGTNTVQLSVANGGGNTGIQVWVGGVNAGTLTVGGTGGWDTYQTKSLTLPAQSGVKDVKLVFVNGNVNVDWLKFAGTTTTPSPSPSPTSSPSPSPSATPTGPRQKFRVVVSSDFPTLPGTNSDPDDVQSMVRFLMYTNEFDVEGLIATAATSANYADKQHILDAIAKYDQVDENLRKHDPAFPSPDYLRSVTFEGRDGTWGKSTSNNIGAGKDSEASNAIISIVDKPDPRPVWFTIWGDNSAVAQAIWKVQNTRTTNQLNTFLSKMRIFAIAHQDDTIDWLKQNFPNLFIIHSNTTYGGMFCNSGDTSLCDLNWLNTNIRYNHGPLGAVYPPKGCCITGVQEGDSPSFLHLLSANRGLNNPEDPTQPSWGGQYKRDGTTNHWIDGPGGGTISKWRPQFQASFAERADWNLP